MSYSARPPGAPPHAMFRKPQLCQNGPHHARPRSPPPVPPAQHPPIPATQHRHAPHQLPAAPAHRARPTGRRPPARAAVRSGRPPRGRAHRPATVGPHRPAPQRAPAQQRPHGTAQYPSRPTQSPVTHRPESPTNTDLARERYGHPPDLPGFGAPNACYVAGHPSILSTGSARAESLLDFTWKASAGWQASRARLAAARPRARWPPGSPTNTDSPPERYGFPSESSRFARTGRVKSRRIPHLTAAPSSGTGWSS